MNRFGTICAALGLACLGAAPASATTIFDDDFTEIVTFEDINLGTTGSLTNFAIVDGTVDGYTDNGFGLPCPSAGCLDLDGTTANAARMESIDLNLTGGFDYTLTLNIAGSRRSGVADTLSFGLFDTLGILVQDTQTLLPGEGFLGLSIAFSLTADTTAKIFLDHAGGDNFGMLLDRVTLTQNDVNAVPVPAALPLLTSILAGFGVMGWRRHKRA